MTRALVTGGAGFVGRHITRRLLSDGVDVVCVDSLNPLGGGARPADWPLGAPSDRGGFTFVETDCRDYFARNSDRFDLVFHLAAIVGGRRVIETQPLAVAENLSIDAEFWLWAGRTLPGYICYFSSSAIYPVAYQTYDGHRALSEDMMNAENLTGNPDMTYGWSKLSGEFLMGYYTRTTGGAAIAFRPFSGYGEDQDLTYPATSICRRLLLSKGASDVTVWGSGRQQRDFIHIDDVVDMIMACCTAKPSVSVVNLCTGTPTDFITLACEAARIIGYDPTVSGLASEPEGVFARYGDPARQSSLGLSPRISLHSGLERCIAFQAERLAVQQ